MNGPNEILVSAFPMTLPEQPVSKLIPTASLSIEPLYERISAILTAARTNVARTVNTEMVRAYWLIGREIVEEEQAGQTRAAYGGDVIAQISSRLQSAFGKGFTATNIRYMRLFYFAYPRLLEENPIHHALRDELETTGQLNPNLSWTHYRLLTRIDSPYSRSFYELEAVSNHWSSRELERQISTLLFERLALSRDKQGLMALATQGQEIQTPADAIKDPVVLEFLGLPESSRLVESDLEEALLSNLQTFLLELGKGFAFVARQQRLTLDGDHFYVDLVFYHAVLKCYVLIDLKTSKLTHGDMGQMQFYVNYYDAERRTEGDNETIGLILCADKNEAVVKYTLGEANAQIFASRYQLHLPSEQELAEEIRRELRQVRPL
jgi:predicted nuclease of restriction endonuclease-like (RecB) superfamily